jgi:hypothetical protein
MIRVAVSSSLTPLERFALDVLVDQSRLLILDGDNTDVVVVSDVGSDAQEAPRPESWARADSFDRTEAHVGIPRALLRSVGAIASTLAEQRSAAADRFGRVPSSVNEVYAAGVARNPIVSRCAIALRNAVLDVSGNRPVALLQPWPNGHRWGTALTHDLDVVEWWPAFTALRIAELAGKSEWRLIRQVLAALPLALRNNPVRRAIESILSAEHDAAIHSSWYVLCGAPTLGSMRRGDLTYRPDAMLTKTILAAIGAGAHEIGLHGSFDTMLSADVFDEQRRHLQALTSSDVRGVRQHYLRMRPGRTQRCMEQVGFAYDATFGFPDLNGFRLGAADVVTHFDAEHGASNAFERVPLVWMDRAVSKYQRIEQPTRWIDDATQLAEVCAEVEGLWVGLWHTNVTTSLGYPEGEQAYRTLLQMLRERRPFIAPLAEIVEWRRRRRHARATAIDERGRPVASPDTGAVPPPLENASGAALDWA